MTEDEVRRRAAEVCRGLDALDEMGDEYEQSETLDHLMRALGPDRTLSDRSLFP